MTSTRAHWAWLTEYLIADNHPDVIISWDELGTIVGGLPESATKYAEWWSGDRSHTRAWRRAGYELVRVDVGHEVAFRKSKPDEKAPTSNQKAGKPVAHSSGHHDSVGYTSLVELQGIDLRSALIVFSCSKKKVHLGEIRSEVAPSGWPPALLTARARVRDVAPIDERLVMPAWRRYDGGFYRNAGLALTNAVASGANVIILSGGYGVVRADEYIGFYDRELKPADWPAGVLEEALLAEATRVGAQNIVAFHSEKGHYADVIRRTPWRNIGIHRAVLVTVPDAGDGATSIVPRDLGLAFAAFWNEQSDGYPSNVQVEVLK